MDAYDSRILLNVVDDLWKDKSTICLRKQYNEMIKENIHKNGF